MGVELNMKRQINCPIRLVISETPKGKLSSLIRDDGTVLDGITLTPTQASDFKEYVNSIFASNTASA